MCGDSNGLARKLSVADRAVHYIIIGAVVHAIVGDLVLYNDLTFGVAGGRNMRAPCKGTVATVLLYIAVFSAGRCLCRFLVDPIVAICCNSISNNV